ncbi:DegV family protein [Fulvimonas soli]|uniref:DegV family protein with EDD domain n=1 Tax=Fulvimonas soli TaxID=155197 RepID=A0A316HYV0_9GAMM|nr:DegV family protein [Fulvimonas soli]PWK85940.1 DegV family protein with EDD domain [Fulvimonas soli]TNY26689.1 fatty acid-binding protein DegV [Fulvimonas soli]
MRMSVAIDASCDLPQAFLQEHGIAVMPIAVRVDNALFKDDRNPAEIRRFLDLKLGSRSHSAETEPCSVEDVQRLFLEKLVLEQDCVFCLTITATRSPINEHVIKASFAILKHYREVREKAGVPGPFLMRVVDTRSLFAGSAPAVVEAVRLIQADEQPAAIRERLTYVANNSYGYMLPRDLYYLRARAKKKGDRSVGLFSAVLGSALDIKPLLRGYRGETGPVGKVRGFEHGAETLFGYVAQRVRAGLLVPAVCVSYGGDLSELPGLPGYAGLREACEATGVRLLEAPMSITGMVNVGEGAVTVGFAAEEHAVEF